MESHLNDKSKLIIPHDDYDILLNNPSENLDVAHSRGKGILIIGRKGLIVSKIFSPINHSRQAITLVKYENDKHLILGSFHLDGVCKRDEVIKFTRVLQEVQRKYKGSDICFYTDLNLHERDKLFLDLQEDLKLIDVDVLIPAQSTRRGF